MKNKALLMTIAILIIAMSSIAQVKGTFTDSRDGKIYKTVKIGTQTWMAENLAYGTPEKQEIQEKQEVCNYTVKFNREFPKLGLPYIKYEYKVFCNGSLISVATVTTNGDLDYSGNNSLSTSFGVDCDWSGKYGTTWYSMNKDIGSYPNLVDAGAAIVKYYFDNKPKPVQSDPPLAQICSYNNDANNAKVYGYLYTWEAAKDACPQGWHLPSDTEWITLIDYLGGKELAGSKMKQKGTIHWNSPNTDATNSSGFTALGGGWRSTSGSFTWIGKDGQWWCSTEFLTISLYCSISDVYICSHGSYAKSLGLSVRCVRDK